MIIFEHYVTAFVEDEKEQYLDAVWDILQKSYASIGGLKGLSKPEDLLDKNIMFKLVRKNNRIVACNIYNTKQGGRKLVAGGTDGSDIGKEAFYKMCAEEVKRLERNSWAEVSGSMEGVFLFKLDATPIPVDVARRILSDKGKDIISVDPDGFHYVREIDGIPMEKIMFGNVPERYRNTEDWESKSKVYRTKFDAYVKSHPDEVKQRKDRHQNKR